MNLLKIGAHLFSPPGAGARLSVMIFHRVAPKPDPLFPGEVDARRFDQILRCVGAIFNILPLDVAVERLARGDLPARALAITFDDGYADNHDVALPVLQRHGMSASFFVATDFLDGGRMWNDTVIESVRSLKGDTLDLDALGLGRFDVSSLAARRSAIDALLKRIKHLEPAERERMTLDIARCSGGALPDDLMMSSSQVQSLRAAGMVIGAHTCSHPILAALDLDSARGEIESGKRRLEDILGEAVDLFAYPNGKPDSDYRAEHVELVRRTGFKAAVSTAPGVSGTGCDLFQIPRFTPWDRSSFRFGLRLIDNLRRSDFATAAIRAT